MLLLAIDPGNDAGYSLWNTDTAHMFECGLGAFPGGVRSDTIVVAERPEFYQGQDPRKVHDLMTLSINLGRHLENAYNRCNVKACYGVYPKTWKGQASKEAHHAAVWKTLSKQAIEVYDFSVAKVAQGKRHNVKDSVALGRWALPRVGILGTSTDYMWTPL